MCSSSEQTDSKGTGENCHTSITLGGAEIAVFPAKRRQIDLLFYEENPRVYSIFHGDEDAITQDEIEKYMCTQEHVKQLAQSIEANGGLIDPLIVQNESNIVFEGNSRLAAYRLLARHDPIKWGEVKCTILPADINDDKIFSLLGEYHIIGRKDWQPYEQAGYLWRRNKKQDVSIQKMATEMGLPIKAISKLIEVYDFMVDHDEVDPQKWSYYNEYLRSNTINKAREYRPEMDEVIVSKIKSTEIKKAVDIRDKVAVIAKKKGTVLKKFLRKENSLESCFQQAVDSGADSVLIKQLERFRQSISQSDVKKTIRGLPASAKKSCEYNLKKIYNRTSELLKLVQGGK